MTTSNSTPIYTILTDVTATMLGADVLRLIVRLESALTTELTRGLSISASRSKRLPLRALI
jgi:hypothetical protein